MDRRRQIQPTLTSSSLHYDAGRAPPGLVSATRRLVDPLPPGPLESKLAAQMAEIEQLAGDRRTLSVAHVALRQDLAAAQQEVRNLRDQIKNTAMEGDMQIQLLLGKIANMTGEISAGDSIKKDLQKAHTEKLDLLAATQVVSAQIQQAKNELDKAHMGVKILPEKDKELHNLRQEHQRSHTNFEYERALNIEKVRQMQAMEKNLLGMAKEVESLRAELLHAEKRARDATLSRYSVTNSHPNPQYQPVTNPSSVYAEIYGRSYAQAGIATTADGVLLCGSGNSVPSYPISYGQVGTGAAVEITVPYDEAAASGYVGRALASTAL